MAGPKHKRAPQYLHCVNGPPKFTHPPCMIEVCRAFKRFQMQQPFYLRLRYTVCSLIIHELLLLFVSSTTLIFMNYAPNMKV